MLLKFHTPDGPIWIAPDKIELVTFPALDYEQISDNKFAEFHIAGCCVVKRIGEHSEIVIGTPDEVVAKINAALEPPAAHTQGATHAGIL